MQTDWPLSRRLLFRFFFIYLAIFIAPWTWLDNLPWANVVTGFFTNYYYKAMDWMVAKSNAWFFHVREQLVPLNGSGDTSYGWALLWFEISIASIGMLIWSILDRKKKEYTKLNYWLCLFTRYYVALVLFSYGIVKLFALQMPFPNYSQLATPLGDFLPMRLSWMFIGYSTPYQFFSGIMETLAGVLLLYRRTATLGVLLATAVFINVAVLNLSYDIPVKIYSIQLVTCCLFLLANEKDRILHFLVYNRAAGASTLYAYDFSRKWMKIARVALKILFVVLAAGVVLWNSIEWSRQNKAEMANMPFAPGMYDVTVFVLNRDTIASALPDSLRWQNMIFDNNHAGSVATADTSFYRRYHRGYFQYKIDTSIHSLSIFKTMTDGATIASFHYQVADDNTILFWGQQRKDSLHFILKRSPHHFQLTERQFHWLSEANR